MSWKKYFNTYSVPEGNTKSVISGSPQGIDGMAKVGKRNYQSFLPEIYSGQANRVDRYYQYELMDQDPEINAALDIISEFCTEVNPENNTTFKFAFLDDPTDVEMSLLNESLHAWYRLNELDRRMFRLFRNTLKYGDQFLIRDPETNKLYHADSRNCDKVIVNESAGKEPEQYIFRNLNVNLMSLNVTQIQPGANGATPYSQAPSVLGATAPRNSQNGFGGGGGAGGRFDKSQEQTAVEAEHVVHISLSEGLDANWPFGFSILENVFKTFKQKELIEDAIIIYRVQRAPERRVFYVDVGNLPSHLAMQYVERVKNEIHQRRIPSMTGGSQNIMDATYNPLSINEDYFFPQTSEGRGSKVDTLPGGENLGQIDDLRFFTNKLFRALRIPSSYLPTGADDSAATYNDGRVGTSLIQELRFNKYCERLQNLVIPSLDLDFKVFLKKRGVNIDTSLFELKFTSPQNFSAFKTVDVDSNRINNFSSMTTYPFISKRWAMERYLGLSQEEIIANEAAWKRENKSMLPGDTEDANLRAVGVTPGTLGSDTELAAGLDAEGAPGAEPGAEPGMPATNAPAAPTPTTPA